MTNSSSIRLWFAALVFAAAVFGQVLAQEAAKDWDVTKPRGKLREIAFKTTEGTIQSIDVSPDGEWLIFDLLAHIYRLPVSGGQAEALTQNSGIAINFDARYSPDGESIAFISDRGGALSLWIMNADGGGAREVLDGGEKSWIGQPVWAPDGNSVFVTRYFIRTHTPQTWVVPTQIWQVQIESGSAERVVGGAMSFVYRPSVPGDGAYLYYERMDAPDNVDGYFQVGDRHHVRRLNLETGKDEAVTEPMLRRAYWDTPFYATAPEISPDGETLAFVRKAPFETTPVEDKRFARSTGLWLRNLDQGTERILTSPINPDLTDTKNGYHLRFANGYDWAPDGTAIYLPDAGSIRRIDVASGAVSTIPFSAQVRRTISEKAAPDFSLSAKTYRPRYFQRPASSPDGRRLVFQAAGRLWTMAFPDGDPQPLVTTAGADQYAPAWSPDGKWIAFTTWNDEEGGHVWKVRASGGKPVKLTERRGEYLNPAWSPDGGTLYAVDGTGALFRGLSMTDNVNYHLVRLPSEGGTPERIMRLETIVRPAVGADGRLAFVAPVAPYAWAGAASGQDEYTARTGLVTMRADGSDRRTIATFPFSQDAVLSWDGAQVAYQEGGNILLGTLPASSEDTAFFNRTEMNETLRWVSQEGGVDPNWFAPDRLEFMNGETYYRYDAATGEIARRELSLELPRQAPSERLAFENVRILTMKDRRVLEQASLVISEGRIVCVGMCETRDGDRIIDATGKTIMPGLIDAHSHLPWDAGIFRQHHPGLAVYLAHGVTTLFEPAARPEEVFPSADLCGAEAVLCPRVLTTGPPLMPDLDMKKIRNPQYALEEARRLKGWGAVSLKQYTQPRRDVRQWITDAAREEGLGVTGERMNLYFDLAMIMDGQSGFEHILAEYPVSTDVATFILQSGVNYTPALQATGQGLYPSEYWRARMDMMGDPKLRRFVPWRVLGRFRGAAMRPMSEYATALWMKTVREIVKGGGSVSAGAHSRADGIGIHWEIWTFATGLTHMEALETATVKPARYLGFGDDLGTLEAGKLADLLVLNSNPLDDIQNTTDIMFVIRNGVVYDDETLDEVWPQNRAYGPRPWAMEEVTSR